MEEFSFSHFNTSLFSLSTLPVILAFGFMNFLLNKKFSVIREHCRLFPTTPVEEKIPKRWITLVERYLNK